jgi:uncharacterized membrane protein
MILENIFFFVLFGIIGVSTEVFFTSLLELVKKRKNRSMTGHSSLWMFFVYGSVYLIILFGRTYLLGINLFLRGFVYLALIYAIEFISGSLLKKLNAVPWDYGNDMKHDYKGIICLEFAPLWYTGGLLFELLYLFLKSHLVF